MTDIEWMIEYTKGLALVGFEVPKENQAFVDAEMVAMLKTFYGRQMHPALIDSIVDRCEAQIRIFLSLGIITSKVYKD